MTDELGQIPVRRREPGILRRVNGWLGKQIPALIGATFALLSWGVTLAWSVSRDVAKAQDHVEAQDKVLDHLTRAIEDHVATPTHNGAAVTMARLETKLDALTAIVVYERDHQRKAP